MENESMIKRLVKKRGVIKAQITSFKNFLIKYQDENAADPSKLAQRLEKLKETFASFDNICDELDQLDEGNDHIAERIATQEEYLDLIYDAEKIIANTHKAISISDGESETAITTGQQHSSSSTQSNTIRLRLPEASLPKFDGKYEQWLSFKDTFLAMIGNRHEISNVEKLQYLKASLTGDAARKLNIFNITEENYTRAWDLLQRSYQDERLIIARHLSLIIRLPYQTKETASGLVRLADETQQHMLSLQSLGVDVGEKLIVQLLVEKLHKITRQKWEESLQRNIFPELKQLIEFLYATASRIAQWEREDREGNSSSHKSTSSKEGKSLKSAKTLVTTAATKCSVCSENSHPLYKCEKFRELPVQARIKIVKEASLCLNCLRSHGKKECKFRNCLRCNERHNTLLHEENTSGTTQAQN